MRSLLLTFVFFLSSHFHLPAQNRAIIPQEGQVIGSENIGNTSIPLLIQAYQKFRVSDFEGALFDLDNAVAQTPNSIEALVFRAKLRKIVGRTREAAIDIQTAERINPYSPYLYGYHGSLGILKLLSFQPEEAINQLSTYKKLNYYYRELDRIASISDHQLTTFTDLEKVVEAIELDQLSKASAILDEVLLSNPQSAIAHDLQGLIFLETGNLDQAEQAFIKATLFQPDLALSWYNLGQVERRKGNFELAKIHLDYAIKLQQDLTKAYFEKAAILAEMGDKDQAIAAYNTIVELAGDTYLEAYVNRGLAKKMLGDYTGALVDFNKAIEENPSLSQADWYKNRGNLQLLLGYHFLAIEDYTKAIRAQSDYAEAYYNRGLAHLMLLDKVSACHDLEKSVEFGYDAAVEQFQLFCTY